MATGRANGWTYTWYEHSIDRHITYDFEKSHWLKNGVIEPTCLYRDYYLRYVSDEGFIKMQKEYFFLISKSRFSKKIKPTKEVKSQPKATSKIKSFVKRSK